MSLNGMHGPREEEGEGHCRNFFYITFSYKSQDVGVVSTKKGMVSQGGGSLIENSITLFFLTLPVKFRGTKGM